MIKLKFILLFIIFTFINQTIFSNENTFIKIEATVEPEIIIIGQEGILKIKITALDSVMISSSPEFVVRLNDSENGIIFAKNFFTASELEFKTKQEGLNVFLDLEKKILIPFKIDESYPLSQHKISGNVIFTAVEKKDNWSVKTFKNFSTTYFKSKKLKIKKNSRNRKNYKKK